MKKSPRLLESDRRKAASHIESVISRKADKDVYKAISDYIDNQTIKSDDLQREIRHSLTKTEDEGES